MVLDELQTFLHSPIRKNMCNGRRYYLVDHDILYRDRTVIGENGQTQIAQNVADNRIAHAFVRELVDQKVQYLLGKPFSIQAEEQFLQKVQTVFDAKMLVLLQRIAQDAVCSGIAWLYFTFGQDGKPAFQICSPENIVPIWKDAAGTELETVIRFYSQEQVNGRNKRVNYYVELWDLEGVRRWQIIGEKLCALPEQHFGTHLSMRNRQGKFGLNWKKIPFIPFRYNQTQQPLVDLIKHLVDDYDRVVSDESNALEDQPNNILVVRNYDGQKLGEFRKNLATYRAVKVSDDGGVSALNTPLDSIATQKHLERLRRDIYAFGRGVDLREQAFGKASSGVALKQAYAALDLDCNALETGIQAGLAELIEFLTFAWEAMDEGNFIGKRAKFIFNRDIVIHEQDAVLMCKESLGILSNETVLANHPWVEQVDEEIQRIASEIRTEAQNNFRNGEVKI